MLEGRHLGMAVQGHEIRRYWHPPTWRIALAKELGWHHRWGDQWCWIEGMRGCDRCKQDWGWSFQYWLCWWPGWYVHWSQLWYGQYQGLRGILGYLRCQKEGAEVLLHHLVQCAGY